MYHNGWVSLNNTPYLFSAPDTDMFPLSSSATPLLAPFFSHVALPPSRGGPVLYGETQDPVLLLRSAIEVNTAFPDLQPAFNPVSLFIVTWLQVPPFQPMDGVS